MPVGAPVLEQPRRERHVAVDEDAAPIVDAELERRRSSRERLQGQGDLGERVDVGLTGPDVVGMDDNRLGRCPHSLDVTFEHPGIVDHRQAADRAQIQAGSAEPFHQDIGHDPLIAARIAEHEPVDRLALRFEEMPLGLDHLVSVVHGVMVQNGDGPQIEKHDERQDAADGRHDPAPGRRRDDFHGKISARGFAADDGPQVRSANVGVINRRHELLDRLLPYPREGSPQ